MVLHHRTRTQWIELSLNDRQARGMGPNILPETNSKFAPENRPSQKEPIVFQPSIFRCHVSFMFQPSIFRGKLAVSFRGGVYSFM